MAKLKTTYSVQSVKSMMHESCGSTLGVGEFDWHSPVRWWQFWRWHLIFKESYILSRASEIVLAYKMAEEMRLSETAEARYVDECTEEGMRMLLTKYVQRHACPYCLKSNMSVSSPITLDPPKYAWGCPCGVYGTVRKVNQVIDLVLDEVFRASS